jgi:tRNA (cmo5U34)-methyltransferase
MDGHASDYFGAMLADYDSLILRSVPDYDEMIARVAQYLPARPPRPRILELGCGTGNLSLVLAGRYPDAELTLVDASAELIEIARARLAELAPGVSVLPVVRRFEDFEPEPAGFDLVTSCIALHHVVDKAQLYAMIQRALQSGGELLFADQMLGATPDLHDVNWQRWLEFCNQPGNCASEELAGLIEHSREQDHYTPVREHFALLEEAGFRDLDCVWRNWIWGVVYARIS